MKTMMTAVMAAMVAGLLAYVPTVGAVTYSFERITDNSSIDVADQFVLDVLEYDDAVLFQFSNLGPLESTITAIYVDDAINALLDELVTIDNSDPGVEFSQWARPQNLPGGSSMVIPFVTSYGLSADADSPSGGEFGNGVNGGETLGIVFSYSDSTVTFDDLIAGLDSGDVRVGLHVQSIAPNGESDSFVTEPPDDPPVHVPDNGSTIVLLGIGILALELARRRYLAPAKR